MKKRPFIVIFVSACFFLLPVFFVLQFMLLNGTDLSLAIEFFLRTPRQLTPFSSWDCIIATVIAYIAGYGIYTVRFWGFWLFLAIMALDVAWNVWAFTTAGSHPPLYQATFFFCVAFPLLLVSMLLFKEIRAPYFNPRLRWWRTPPRYAMNLKCALGLIVDISIGGVFVESSGKRKLGATETLRFEAFDQKVEVDGTIVWISPGSANKPKGFGIKFVNITPETRRALKHITGELKKLGRKNREYESVKA